MRKTLSIADIGALYEQKGDRAYSGEPVSQLEHALQTAQHAEVFGAKPALIVASLLHDLGHLLNDRGETPTARGIDDVHQYYALPFLRGLFGDDVLRPIRLHVDAKRYLCTERPDYFRNLSEDSRRSLALQGGAFDSEQAARFLARPFAADAVRLREWDDCAKTAGALTPPLSHYLALIEFATVRG